MEIGSFIELDLRDNREYYYQNGYVARLNAARAGIYHATRILGCSVIYLPYYLCHVVRDFLQRKGLVIRYFYLSEKFEPLLETNPRDTAILIVNYFGILSNFYVSALVKKFHNVIIDNSQAFFCQPVRNCHNVYSPRKFFGVPDGCYLVGRNANHFLDEYKQDNSSGTASFLLKRIELGSSAVYKERMYNEDRINNSDILRMSELTLALMKNLDYIDIRKRRLSNFRYAHTLFNTLNMLNPMFGMDDDTVPMIYPLVIEDSLLDEKLRKKKIYTGRWWKHVTREAKEDSFEVGLSQYMLPIPIDQRYSSSELDHIKKELISVL